MLLLTSCNFLIDVLRKNKCGVHVTNRACESCKVSYVHLLCPKYSYRLKHPKQTLYDHMRVSQNEKKNKVTSKTPVDPKGPT